MPVTEGQELEYGPYPIKVEDVYSGGYVYNTSAKLDVVKVVGYNSEGNVIKFENHPLLNTLLLAADLGMFIEDTKIAWADPIRCVYVKSDQPITIELSELDLEQRLRDANRVEKGSYESALARLKGGDPHLAIAEDLCNRVGN
jgi:hypothetical protein